MNTKSIKCICIRETRKNWEWRKNQTQQTVKQKDPTNTHKKPQTKPETTKQPKTNWEKNQTKLTKKEQTKKPHNFEKP